MRPHRGTTMATTFDTPDLPELAAAPVACVGGQALHRPGERPDDAALRQRACT